MPRQTTSTTRRVDRTRVELVPQELLNRRIERDQDIGQYPTTRLHDVDAEESDTPVIDPFRAFGGANAIAEMTNFTQREFNELWLTVRDYVVANYGVGREKRSDVKPKDAFFMTLVVLKEGGTWDNNAKLFRLPTTTFTKVVSKFIKMLAPKLYVDQVEDRCDQLKMRTASTTRNVFDNFPCALYAVDVTFQQSYRPGGSIAENGSWYSGKHHLHGLKVEVSVDKRGFAINCSEHAKGSIHDITMFKNNKTFHLSKIKKLPGDESLNDNGPLRDFFLNEWAILADKEYQGIAAHLRCIHPKKGRSLSRADQATNDPIALDRVIVENFLGRLNQLWRITSDKYRWSRELYDDAFRFCLALTDHHIQRNPLRDIDGGWYMQSQNKLIEIGRTIKEKRRLAQEKYRAKKRRRQSATLDDLGGEADASEEALTQLSQAF